MYRKDTTRDTNTNDKYKREKDEGKKKKSIATLHLCIQRCIEKTLDTQSKYKRQIQKTTTKRAKTKAK